MGSFLTQIHDCDSHSRSLTVTHIVLLFPIYLFLLTLIFVLSWLSFHYEMLIILLFQFPFTFCQTQRIRNNSETVKAVTLRFCSIQQLFIRTMPHSYLIGIPYSSRSVDIRWYQMALSPSYRFLVNLLQTNFIVTPEPVIIVT